MKKIYTLIIFTAVLHLEGKLQNVGVGESAPASKLSVKGNLTVGSGYSTSAAPSNGLAVEGNVGIGTLTPQQKLDVKAASATTIGINTNGYAQDMSGRLARNLVSSFCWNIGTQGVGIFYPNQTTANENVREWGNGPHGQRAILWKCAPSGDGDADGGWNSQSFDIDHTKTYRVSVWVKRTGNLSTGLTYFGCSGSNLTYLNGTDEPNPYFYCGTLPQVDRWYLIVGYIHGSGDASTTHAGGVYDGVTGQKVISLNGGSNCTSDFKFKTSATTQFHRAYLYYNNESSNRQFFGTLVLKR